MLDPDDENNGTDISFTATLPLVTESLDLFQLSVSDRGLVRLFASEDYAQNYESVFVTVTAADGGEDLSIRVAQSFELNLVEGNVAPIITSSEVTMAMEDSLYTYQVEAYDPVFTNRGATESKDDLTTVSASLPKA